MSRTRGKPNEKPSPSRRAPACRGQEAMNRMLNGALSREAEHLKRGGMCGMPCSPDDPAREQPAKGVRDVSDSRQTPNDSGPERRHRSNRGK